LLLGAGCSVLAVGSQRWCVPDRCDLLNISSTYIRASMMLGWQWVAAHPEPVTFAYSGNNVPYPLTGDQLTNRVYYVNIDRHAQWRFHDYARARGRRADAVSSELARSSGVLLAADAATGGGAGTVRPRYERMIGYRDAWVDNLKQAGVDYLFISALSAYEINYLWHDERGFPIEQQWAQADPQAFQLVYENPTVRIYHVALR